MMSLLSLSRSSLCWLSALTLLACEPSAPLKQAQQLKSVVERLPEEVVAYGGSDDLQAWLLRLQRYAQGAYANTPAFASFLPSLLASGVGLSKPQLIDLSQPLRWVVAPPNQELIGQDKISKPEAPRQHSPYLTLPARPAQPLWRGAAILTLRSSVRLQDIETALSPSLWARSTHPLGTALSPLFERVSSSGELSAQERAYVLIRGAHLMVSNDLELLKRAQGSLEALRQQPYSQELKVSARLAPLARYLKRAHPRQLEELDPLMRAWLEGQRGAREVSFELKGRAEVLTLELSAEHSEPSPLHSYTVSGVSPLKQLPLNTQGWLITSSAFPPLKSALSSVEGLPKALKLLVEPPRFAATFALNERLELSALATGASASERGAWIKAALYALRDAINQAQQAREAHEPKRAQPSAPDALLVSDEPIGGDKVEGMKIFKLPTLKPGSPTPELEQLSVQLSEARVLYAPEATFVTFGLRSRARLEAWRALSTSAHEGLLARPDVAPLKDDLDELLLMLYLSPPALERLMGRALRVGDAGEGVSDQKDPMAGPQKTAPAREEGLSLTLKAHPLRSAATLTLPVSMTKRLVSGVLRGVPLDLTKGVRSPQHPAYKNKRLP